MYLSICLSVYLLISVYIYLYLNLHLPNDHPSTSCWYPGSQGLDVLPAIAASLPHPTHLRSLPSLRCGGARLLTLQLWRLSFQWLFYKCLERKLNQSESLNFRNIQIVFSWFDVQQRSRISSKPDTCCCPCPTRPAWEPPVELLAQLDQIHRHCKAPLCLHTL